MKHFRFLVIGESSLILAGLQLHSRVAIDCTHLQGVAMFHNEIIAGLKILQLSRHPSDRIDLKIGRSRKRDNSQASSHQLLLGDLDGKLGITLVLLVRLHHLQHSVSHLHFFQGAPGLLLPWPAPRRSPTFASPPQRKP